MGSAAEPKAAILIVEDEALIRMAAVDFVEDAGFATVEASNADDALTILFHGQPVSGVFSDIDMPGTLDGIELARTVRQLMPEMPVVLASGRDLATRDALPSGVKFFSKPYDLDEVLSVFVATC